MHWQLARRSTCGCAWRPEVSAADLRARYWGLFVTGMWLSTGLAMLVEVALAVLALVAAGVYVMLNPGQLLSLQQFAHELSGVCRIVGCPHRVATVAGSPLGVLRGACSSSPELPRSSRRVPSPSRFGRSSIDLGCPAKASWPAPSPVLVLAWSRGCWPPPALIRSGRSRWPIRGGSSVMHIAAAAVAGYGIVAFRRTRRLASLLGGYLAAITDSWPVERIGRHHGIWRHARLDGSE